MKFKVTVESVRVETLTQFYEADSLMEALDKARVTCNDLNRPRFRETPNVRENFHVSKIEEDKS
jgi:hypothetical protein